MVTYALLRPLTRLLISKISTLLRAITEATWTREHQTWPSSWAPKQFNIFKSIVNYFQVSVKWLLAHLHHMHHDWGGLWVWVSPGLCSARRVVQLIQNAIELLQDFWVGSNGQTNTAYPISIAVPWTLYEFMERRKKRRTVICDDVQFWEQQQKEENLQQNPTYNLTVAEIEAGARRGWLMFIVFGLGCQKVTYVKFNYNPCCLT